MKLDRFFLTAVALFVFASTNCFAQGPNDSGEYYKAADGKKGAELKTALCGVIYNRTSERTYKQLWTDFQTTDVREDGKVWDMYSNITNFTFIEDQDKGSHNYEGKAYNREHSFPKSWFGGEIMPMYTDLFHLYPTDGKVNENRGDKPFGETNGSDKNSANDFSKIGTCTVEGFDGVVFEPNDIYKGDFARTYFYMVTCYEEKLPDWINNGNANNTIDGSKYPGLQTWQLNMLLKWAIKDPVSEKEINRNNAVYSIQGNRNPFIDYPELERFIWGDLKDVAFSYDHYSTTGIENLQDDVQNDVPEAIYSPDGRRLEKMQRGLNIVRTKSRRTIKVVIK